MEENNTAAKAECTESTNEPMESDSGASSPQGDGVQFSSLTAGEMKTSATGEHGSRTKEILSPAASSTDGELSSDSAPSSPKGFYGAVDRDALEKISDDDSLDLISEPASPAANSLSRYYSNAEGSKSADNHNRAQKQTSGEPPHSNSGKPRDFAQSYDRHHQNSGKSTVDILSDDDHGGDVASEPEEGSLSVNSQAVNSQKERNEHKQSTDSLSVHDRLDLSLRGAHDDHGELDYEEDVDDGLETSKKDEKDTNTEEKEEGEESEAEDGEHVSDDTDGELNDDDDCEEGEIKDTAAGEDTEEVEENRPPAEQDDYSGQPLCRFYMRGSCTWGLNCRFFHPGMPNGSFNDGRKPWDDLCPVEPDTMPLPPPPPPVVPAVETAWERGLRQARELRKKSQKRKEMEPDFEEKRKNLSLNDTDILEEPVLKSVPEDVDFNKENEREPIIPDPYYDDIYDDDKDFTYSAKEPIEGWHGSGHYENFEVLWTRDHHRHVPDPYPEYRPSERERVITKDKYPSKYRYNQAPAHDRYDKKKELPKSVYKKNDKYESYEDIPDKMKRLDPVKDVEVTRVRGEEWIDPWQRARSPVRRKNSSSRSRSRGRRRTRSGSGSSSYSSDSFSSRSSSYSSRSLYSRSSSYSSRSSSGSRSPPPRRKPLLSREPQKKIVLPSKSSEIPSRSLVAKAGPVVPSAAINKDVDHRRPIGVSEKRLPGPERRPPGPAHRPGAVMPLMDDTATKLPEGPPKPPAMQKPVQKPVQKPGARSGMDPGRTVTDPRPGRSLRPRTRSFSSGSSSSHSRSRSRSYSSSGSSSRSRSRSSSASSSSSSSSSDSDDLYRDMASPVDSRGSGSPSPNKGKRKPYRGPSKDSQDSWKSSHDVEKHNSSRSQQEPFGQRKDEKPAVTPVVSQTKDPLKLQGQKLNIKLTLKSSKSADPSAAKKRPLDVAGDGPPNKKPYASPVKEVKEPIRMTLPKTDKLVKSAKDVSDSPGSKTQMKAPVVSKPVITPTTITAPVSEPAAVPKKKSTSSRREELLKQLKAVEDAIARKRTKLN